MINYLNKIRKNIIDLLIICTCCCPINLYADWELVGSEYLSDGYKECLELVFSNGIPYVVFAEQLTSPEMSGISVMKLENNHWTYVGQPGFAGNFYDNVGAVGISFPQSLPVSRSHSQMASLVVRLIRSKRSLEWMTASFAFSIF